VKGARDFSSIERRKMATLLVIRVLDSAAPKPMRTAEMFELFRHILTGLDYRDAFVPIEKLVKG
jgi:hypothetical protein